jgi:hypothetical protein
MEARVPRYFFNVHDGRSAFDSEGTELASRDAARITAIQFTGEILRDDARLRKFGDDWHLEVLDVAGAKVCTVDVRVSVPVADG